jgi:hypothetical protein
MAQDPSRAASVQSRDSCSRASEASESSNCTSRLSTGSSSRSFALRVAEATAAQHPVSDARAPTLRRVHIR